LEFYVISVHNIFQNAQKPGLYDILLKYLRDTDHFTRFKQHWSRSTSCFSL